MGKKDKQFYDKASAEDYILTQSTLAAITSIAIALNQRKGAGFFLSGPFGSGKTRLLMTLRDLSVTQGESPRLQAGLEVFNDPDQRQIQFVRQVFQTHRITPCYVNLGVSNQSLSAALQDTIHQQRPQIFPDRADLVASFDAIDANMLTNDYDMLVDELASNLDSREVSDALQDIIFLQQLGEAVCDHRVVVVLTVHKSIQVLGGMRYDQLSKFRGRYRVLPLHVEGALARRFSTHFDDDDLVVTPPRSYHHEIHEVTRVYDVHEYQAAPPTVTLADAEAPDWLTEIATTVIEPPIPPMTVAMDPVRELAKILMEHCVQSDLDFFLQSKGITGKTWGAQVLELCIMEDPLIILTELFGVSSLREMAKDLELEGGSGRSPDQLRETILVRLGFSIPKKPIGINTYRRKLIRLQSSLQLKEQRADIVGIGLEGCDDVGDRVLKDIIAFYCTVLLGTDYEQVLWEEALVPAGGRPGVDGLTFGQKIGLFERLNGYLKRHEEIKDLMRKWFDRIWVIKNRTHLEKYLIQVSPRRNHLAHSQGIDTATLKQEADKALKLLVELFRQFEEQLIYPPVVAVETVQVDRYGRRTFICVDDRGCKEHLFTDSELAIGQEYFFYPVTNPIRVDPLIVPKQ